MVFIQLRCKGRQRPAGWWFGCFPATVGVGLALDCDVFVGGAAVVMVLVGFWLMVVVLDGDE